MRAIKAKTLSDESVVVVELVNFIFLPFTASLTNEDKVFVNNSIIVDDLSHRCATIRSD